ncbi:hypothetical protein SAMD00019534_016190, partial [Acytostelium subglobosum LB1]|uniref:hypothetical protein n=1 Tax=Acytostelium subglobosum LB1 TaxID=1410327 RepID=UPI0006449D0C
DYVPKFDKFKEWMLDMKRQKIPVLNDVDKIMWNWDKKYLLELENAGIDIIPSIFIDRSSTCTTTLIQLIEEGKRMMKFPSDQQRFVMKPCLGADSYGTFQFTTDNWQQYQDMFTQYLAHSDMIIQPFAESVLQEGELSFVFFNQEFSHSIIKHPPPSDFRVQETYGGSVEPNPNPNLNDLSMAKKVMEYVGRSNNSILYTRVDLLRYNGKLCVGECELIEPTLYFLNDQVITNRFIDQLLGHIVNLITNKQISITSSTLSQSTPNSDDSSDHQHQQHHIQHHQLQQQQLNQTDSLTPVDGAGLNINNNINHRRISKPNQKARSRIYPEQTKAKMSPPSKTIPSSTSSSFITRSRRIPVATLPIES